MKVLCSKTGPGVGRKERWCVAEESVKTSLKGPTDAADDLAGSTPGTLEDVASWWVGGEEGWRKREGRFQDLCWKIIKVS